MQNNFNFSSKACVFRKSYGGDIHVTLSLELPRGNLKKDKRNKAIKVFKDERKFGNRICDLRSIDWAHFTYFP